MLKRVKRRYVALAIDCSEPCNASEFMDAAWGSVSKLYGEHGASRVNMSLISFDQEKKSAVIRVNHTGVEPVRTAVAAMTKVGDKPAAVHVLMVSGTLKALHKKLKW